MFQHIFDSGSILNVADLLYVNLDQTPQVMLEEIRILVDTSEPRTVVLPRTTDFPVRNVKITVVDVSGGASLNNISVIPTSGVPLDSINGTTGFTIAIPYASTRFEVLSSNKYYSPNFLGGSSAVVSADNGLSLNGTVVELGGTIIKDTLITVPDAYALSYTNSDNSINYSFGKQGSINGVFFSSSTADQVLAFSLEKDTRIGLFNQDVADQVTRRIRITTSSQSVSPPSVQMTEGYNDGFNYSFISSGRVSSMSALNANIGGVNGTLVKGVFVDVDSIYGFLFYDESLANSSRGGWLVNYTETEMYYGADSSGDGGTRLTLSADGWAFTNAGSVKFQVSDSGILSTLLPSYANEAAAGALLAGQLYQTTGAAPSPLNVAGIVMVKQ